MQMYKSLYKRILLVIAVTLFYNKTIARSFWEPKCIHIGVDMGKIIYYNSFSRNFITDKLSYNYTSDNPTHRKPVCPKYKGSQYEFNLAVQCKNLILDIDFGFGSIQWENVKTNINDAESIYKNKGNYIKFGFDYNFLRDTPECNAAFLGLRYGMAFFNDSLSSNITFCSKREPYNDIEGYTARTEELKNKQPAFSTDQKNVRATWFETVAGIKLKILGPIFIGANISYKFWLNISNANEHKPYEIMGWGMTSDPVDNTVFGGSLYLSFAIPIGSDDKYDRKEGRKEIENKESLFGTPTVNN